MNTDLTTGNTSRLLWAFSIPMLISVVFQQFYNIADSIIAGRFIGEQALAAVGASYPITMIFMAVAIGSSIGCTVVISQLFDSKHYAMLKTAVGTICYSGAIKLNTFGVTCMTTLSNGLSSFTAQNLGAGKKTVYRKASAPAPKWAFWYPCLLCWCTSSSVKLPWGYS